MLIGEFIHSLDNKGRTALPVKFKTDFGKKVFLTRGLDNCLSVYTASSWKKMNEKLSNLSLSKSSERGFSRFMLAGAVEVSPDKQGRVLIPEYLREFAGLSKKIIWTGNGDNAEIWDEKKWQKYLEKNTQNPEAMAESLEGII